MQRVATFNVALLFLLVSTYCDRAAAKASVLDKPTRITPAKTTAATTKECFQVAYLIMHTGGQQRCEHTTESISLFVQLLSRYWRPIPAGYSGIILMFLIDQYPLQRINLQMMFEQFLCDVTKLIHCGSTQNPKISYSMFTVCFELLQISCLLQRCTKHAISVISSDRKNPMHFIIGCFREIVFFKRRKYVVMSKRPLRPLLAVECVDTCR